MRTDGIQQEIVENFRKIPAWTRELVEGDDAPELSEETLDAVSANAATCARIVAGGFRNKLVTELARLRAKRETKVGAQVVRRETPDPVLVAECRLLETLIEGLGTFIFDGGESEG